MIIKNYLIDRNSEQNIRYFKFIKKQLFLLCCV